MNTNNSELNTETREKELKQRIQWIFDAAYASTTGQEAERKKANVIELVFGWYNCEDFQNVTSISAIVRCCLRELDESACHDLGNFCSEGLQNLEYQQDFEVC